jgi:hypothetical protein
MDKHTPLTKNEKKKKQNPHRKKKTIFKRKNQNTKKSQVPLTPTQKNKYHCKIAQNLLQENFLPRHG